jgi:hypothetical protein
VAVRGFAKVSRQGAVVGANRNINVFFYNFSFFLLFWDKETAFCNAKDKKKQ